MKFPVDLLADVSQEELERLSYNYMDNLLYSNPDSPEHLKLSDSTQVTINISSVGFVPLYGSNDKRKILALFSPSDPITAVALYLLDRWWAVEDIVKTADPDRNGVLEVETLGERIVLYILNRVIYRAKEMSSEELPFLCHGEKDHAKILWDNGEAVGFYSVKPTGSLCHSFLTRSYQLPVMDSIFVRRSLRGKGYGVQMLEDFVLSFKEDCLGLRYPLTKPMYKVCEKYLCQYPGDTDLLWEVESVGGPTQRANIASKIQAMNLSAVSKTLQYTEESLVITEVTKKDMAMESVTTELKDTVSMECTVEILEEVTVLRSAKAAATTISEDEVPVAARERTGSSKGRKTGEQNTENKSEKVIRIEDIEAETPRDEQVSVQQTTELHDVSELVQTEGLLSAAPEEKDEVVDDNALQEEEAVMSDKPNTVLASQDADVISAAITEEPHAEDDASQDLHSNSNSSQITVENVASEIEEAEEECQKEDTVVLIVSEVSKEHEEAETQSEGTDEKLEEQVVPQEDNQSTHTTSEDAKGRKTGKAVVKAIKTVLNETPRRRSQRHKKPEEAVTQETTAKEGGRVLRGRTVKSTPTSKRKYTPHRQREHEESEKEAEEVAEKNEVSTTEVTEEKAVTEGEEPEEITSIREDADVVEESKEETQQLEDEQIPSEEETEKEEEPEVEDTVEKESSAEVPDTAETVLLEENDDKTDKQMEERHQVEQVKTVNTTEEEILIEKSSIMEEGTVSEAEEAGEDATEVNAEEDIQEKEETEGKTETEMEPDKEGESDDMIQEPDSDAAASETVIPHEVLDEAPVQVAEEPLEKNIGFKIPKLQSTTVVLVDLKTTCHHLTVNVAEKKRVGGECPAPENEQMQLTEREVSSGGEEQTSEPQMLALEEEDGGNQKNSTEKSVDVTAEAEAAEKALLQDNSPDKEAEESTLAEEKTEAEEVPVIETRVLRSGRRIVKESCETTSGSNKKLEEGSIDEVITEKVEVDEAEMGTVEVQEETKVMDATTAVVSEEEKQPAVSKGGEATDPPVDDPEDITLPAEADEAVSLEKEEAPVVTRALRGGTKTAMATPRHKATRGRKQVDEQEAREISEEEPMVTTRTRGRISAAATPKGKSRRTHKQIQEEKHMGEEADKCSTETTAEKEEGMIEATMENTDKEIEENTEEEKGEKVQEEAASEKEEHTIPETDVDEWTSVEKEAQDVVEEQSEAISKIPEERETIEAECDETKPVVEDEEVTPTAVAVTRSLRGGEKTSISPPKTRARRSKKHQGEETGASAEKSADEDEPPAEPRIMRRGVKSFSRNQKPLQKEDDGSKKSAKEVEMEEAAEGDEKKAPEEDTIDAEKEEIVTVTEEEENTVGVKAPADDSAQEGDTDTPPPQTAPESDVPTPTLCEEEAASSAEEQQSEEMVTQIPNLQRVTVVLVDLKKAQHEVHGETAAVEKDALVQTASAEAEEEHREDTMKEEETMAEDPTSQVRVLRSAKKTIPKITHTQLEEGEEEEGGEELAAVEKNEVVEEKEKAEEQKLLTDQDSEQGQEVSGEDLAGSSETIADENAEAPAGHGADEVKTLDNVAEEAVIIQDTVEEEQSTSTSEVVEHVAGEGAQEVSVLTTEDEAKEMSDEEAAPVNERVLRSGKKSVRSGRKTTKSDEQETEAAAETSTAIEETAVEQRVLRKGRRSAAVTAKRKSKRVCTQRDTEEEEDGEEETSPAEEVQVEEAKIVLAEDATTQREENTEPEVEIQEKKAAAEELLTEPETEEEQAAVSVTSADGQEDTAVGETVEETTVTDEGQVTEEEGAPNVEKRIIGSGGKTRKATSRSKAPKSPQQEKEQEGTAVEKSPDTEEPTVEARVLRKGRRSAPATPRRKSKRARTQFEPEEEVTTPAEDTEEEEKEEGQESPEETGEKAEEEGGSAEMEENNDKDMLTEESAAGRESGAGDVEQMKNPLIETAAEMAAVDETGTDTNEISSADGGETREEDTTVLENTVTEAGADTAIAEEEALVEDKTGVAEDEAPGVTTRILRSKTKVSHATPSRKTRRQKDQGEVETQQQEEESSVDEETQEENSAKNGELNAKEQAETEEPSSTGPEAGPSTKDTAEDLVQETAGLIDEEPAGEEKPSERTEENSVGEGRYLRKRMKTILDKEEDKAEDIHTPKRRSRRKRPRVNYTENDEEDGLCETEAASDKEEDDQVESDDDIDSIKAQCSTDDMKVEDSSKEENSEDIVGSVESASEKGGDLNLVLDTDEEVHQAGVNQEEKEDEQNMSEEEAEPALIRERPTPRSKSRRSSAKGQKAEESLSDEEEKTPRRRLRKRKSTEVTPPRRSKRFSRI